MKKVNIVKAIAASALFFIIPGCGDTNPGDAPIFMTPSSATLSTGQTQQFTITVGGVVPTGVTWAIGDTTGNNLIADGNATVGMVSASGLYTAPATVPTPSQITVVASKSGTSGNGSGTRVLSFATVTITGTAAGQTPTTTITVSPDSITLGDSATLMWVTANVNSCLINGESTIGGVTVGIGGSASVSPSQTTTYALACTGPNGPASAQATLTIGSTPPSSGITISPATASGASGTTIHLTATVPGDVNNEGVVWTTSLEGYGTLPVSTGPYTADYTLPTVSQTTVVTVTARSTADSNNFGTATVTVTPL